MTEYAPKLVVDAQTGESAYIELTEEEIAQIEADKLAHAEAKAQAEAAQAALDALKASAKAKLIAGEPLTEEETAVLGL
jgi:hypothetical protein